VRCGQVVRRLDADAISVTTTEIRKNFLTRLGYRTLIFFRTHGPQLGSSLLTCGLDSLSGTYLWPPLMGPQAFSVLP
jgi:hypothetical protein